MNAPQRILLHAVAATLLATLSASPAAAQTGASGNAGPGASFVIPQAGFGASGSPRFDWFDPSSSTGAVEVSYDPTQGPIRKQLEFDPDQDGDGDTDLNDLGIIFGGPIELTELLLVGPGPDWTDWHETILTPGWEWAPDPSLTAIGVPTNTTTQLVGPQVDFFFDPLPPGTLVEIEKQLIFTGDLSDPGFVDQVLSDLTNGALGIDVLEFPTVVPEPATAGLLVLGAAATGFRRRRS